MMQLRKTLTAAIAGVVLTASLAGAQEDASAQKPKKQDPEVKVALKEFDTFIKDKKMKKDGEAVAIIDTMLTKARDGMHPKDEKAFVTSLQKGLNGKLRDPEQISLYQASALALGELGPVGAKVLKKAYNSKKFPEKPPWVPLRAIFLENVGKTKDEAQISFLVEEARRAHEEVLMAAAGAALGNFAESKVKKRQEIVTDLLIRYGEVHGKAESSIDTGNVEAQNARDRLSTIQDKWNDTLSKLTRQDFRSFPEWQSWWNDNKSNAKAWK